MTVSYSTAIEDARATAAIFRFDDYAEQIRNRNRSRLRGVGLTDMLSLVMSSLAWLGLVVLIVAAAAITGLKPKGTRHVAHTRLMGVARLVLLALIIIFAYLAFRAHSGG